MLALYPEADLTENFCRNPDGGDNTTTIWCYQTTGDRLGYCDPIVVPTTTEVMTGNGIDYRGI